MDAIEIENLVVGFGRKKVLDQLTLRVPAGTVCALLGPNGAGKTTLIRTLMNIYPRHRGVTKVLGVDSEKISPAELCRIGYVAESQEIPLWMRVQYFLDYCAAFYPNWDKAWCEQKVKELELPLKSKLSELSRGMRIKAMLISSLAYHPELLILDEPFSGLDPIVRDEFIDSVIQLANETKATTLISSHDLTEVERIADSIAFISQGKVQIHKPLDDLLESFRAVTVQIPGEIDPSRFPGTWVRPRVAEGQVRFVHQGYSDEIVKSELAGLSKGIEVLSCERMSLKDIYKTLAGKEFF